MTVAPFCHNPESKHRSSYYQMTRLYVRRQHKTPTGSKRTWEPIGWICDPANTSTWGGPGCGTVKLDEVKEDDPSPAPTG